MSASRSTIAICCLAAALALRCAGDDPAPFVPVPNAEPVLLAVNSRGETLSLVRLATHDVTPNALPLGDAPNDIAVDASGTLAAVVNSLSNSLWFVALTETLRVAGEIDFGRGASPYAVEFDGAGGAFVSLHLTGEVARVDVASRSVVATTAVGRTPEGILIAGAFALVTIANYTVDNGSVVRFGPGAVAVLDAATGALLRTVAVGVNPQAAALAPDGRIHVVCTGNYGNESPPSAGIVYVLDAGASSVVDSLPLGGSPAAIAITASGKAYVAGDAGGLLAYDALTLEPIAPLGDPLIPLGGFFDLLHDDAARRLYLANFTEDLIFVLDSEADTIVTAYPAGDGPVSIALRR
ncbi:MAG: YncE family protein [bacterium]